jgi:hypothetical protein
MKGMMGKLETFWEEAAVVYFNIAWLLTQIRKGVPHISKLGRQRLQFAFLFRITQILNFKEKYFLNF